MYQPINNQTLLYTSNCKEITNKVLTKSKEWKKTVLLTKTYVYLAICKYLVNRKNSLLKQTDFSQTHTYIYVYYIICMS